MPRALTILIVVLTVLSSPDTAGAAVLAPPPPKVVVVQTACPDGSGGPCADQQAGVVYLPSGTSRFARTHEIGHIVDARYLDPGERSSFTRLVGLNGEWLPRTGTMAAGMLSPAERFADSYAACQMKLTPGRNWVVSYGYSPSIRHNRRICSFIERALQDMA